MQNNIPTLYILKLDSFVVKSAKISIANILCLFVQKIKNIDCIAMTTVTTELVHTEIQQMHQPFLRACSASYWSH